MKRLRLVAVLALLGWASVGWGYLVAMLPPSELEKVIGAYVKAHPDDAEGYFCLGRVNVTSWALGKGDANLIEVAARGSDRELPRFPPWGTVMMRRGADREQAADFRVIRPMFMQRTADGEPTEDAARSLAKALQAYQRAVALDGGKPRYHLALACALEEMSRGAPRLPADFDWSFGAGKTFNDGQRQRLEGALAQLANDDAAVRDRAGKALLELMPLATGELAAARSTDPEVKARVAGVVATYWQMQAVGEYRKAFAATVTQDLALPRIDDLDDVVISAEAGERLLVLLAQMPQSAEKGEVQTIKDALARLSTKEHIGHFF